MRYTQFRIVNFKGIKDIAFDLKSSPDMPIYTLVGLNESGKTTILDAISFFYDDFVKKGVDTTEREDLLYSIKISDMHELIPRDQIGNFNGLVEFYVSLETSDDDEDDLRKILSEENYDLGFLPKRITIKTTFSFKNSKFEVRRSTITGTPSAKTKRSRKAAVAITKISGLWVKYIAWIKSKMNPIIYYPNFLFEFPEKIYLTRFDGETPEHKFYRSFIQDVLDTLGKGYKIQEHIIDRLEEDTDSGRTAVDAIVSQIESLMTSLVFKSDLSVFTTNMSGKEVKIGNIRRDDNSSYYLEIKIKDGLSTFKIRETSLGFRWFFTFLLLTQFRLNRLGSVNPIFMLDEPASNLHQAAQQRILIALDRLTHKGNSRVIYTTHSHHMINPNWLENAFVVINGTENDDDAIDTRNTNIQIERYRSFVGSHEDQTSYFKPILDRLEYQPSNLENIPDAVLVEGKNDFYTLKYMIMLCEKEDIRVFPGGGASSLDPLISLYSGWGKNFIVLVDSDGEGEKQIKRYKDKFESLLDEKIFGLSELINDKNVGSMESLFTENDKEMIRSLYFSGEKISKKRFNVAIQELLATKKVLEFESKSKFSALLDSIKDKVDYASKL